MDTVLFGKSKEPITGSWAMSHTIVLNCRANFAEDIAKSALMGGYTIPRANHERKEFVQSVCNLADDLYDEMDNRGWTQAVPEEMLPQEE